MELSTHWAAAAAAAAIPPPRIAVEVLPFFPQGISDHPKVSGKCASTIGLDAAAAEEASKAKSTNLDEQSTKFLRYPTYFVLALRCSNP